MSFFDFVSREKKIIIYNSLPRSKTKCWIRIRIKSMLIRNSAVQCTVH